MEMMSYTKWILVQKKFQLHLTGLFVFFLTLFASQDLSTQNVIDWDYLADVTFEEQYDEEIQGLWLIPKFGDIIKSYQNKIVSLEGYLINLDFDYTVIVLSKNPYSSCFFCGMAGPETVVEIQLNDPIDHIKLDQRAKIHGRLILNKNDFDHFNYILQNAEIELVE